MRINLHYDELLNHTSFYRAVGPFSALVEPDGKIQLNCYTSQPSWVDVQKADVAFVHRPFMPEHLGIIQKYKAFGIPVWIDYDDDFFGIPQSSPVYEKIAAATAMVKQSLKEADVVTVTTECLKAVYSKFNKNIQVISNALPDQLVPFRKPVGKLKRFVWRGNNTHARDINSVKNQLLRVARAHLDWDWIFLGGYRPWEICEEMENIGATCHVHPWIGDVYDYLHFLKSLEASILIVPMEDHPFNHSKSNIAWMEATWAGCLSIAPAWPEWKGRGGITYDDNYDFEHAVEGMIDAGSNCTTEPSWKYITKNLLLSEINYGREGILADLMERK